MPNVDPIIVSLGRNCQTRLAANHCSNALIGNLPFDSITTTPEFIIDSLNADFANWWDLGQYYFTPNINDTYNPNNIHNLDIDYLEESPILMRSRSSDLRAIHELTASSVHPAPISYESFFNSGELTLKPGELEKVCDKYRKAAVRFRQTVSQRNWVVFLREDYHEDYKPDRAEALFDAILRYCRPSKFIFLYILSKYTDHKQIKHREEPSMAFPELLRIEEGSYVYTVHNLYYENVKLFKFVKPLLREIYV